MRLRTLLMVSIIMLLFFGDLDKKPERFIIIGALTLALIVHVYFLLHYVKAYWLMPEYRDHERLSTLGFKLEKGLYVNNAIECVIIPENGWQVVFHDDDMAEMGDNIFTYTKWSKRNDTYIRSKKN